MINISLSRIFLMLDYARIAKNYAMAWHITINIGIRRYENIITYDNLSNNGCIDANPNLISNRGCAFSYPTILLTKGNTLMDIAVRSNDSLGVDGHAIGMA